MKKIEDLKPVDHTVPMNIIDFCLESKKNHIINREKDLRKYAQVYNSMLWDFDGISGLIESWYYKRLFNENIDQVEEQILFNVQYVKEKMIEDEKKIVKPKPVIKRKPVSRKKKR
jgi:hypothetical protein